MSELKRYNVYGETQGSTAWEFEEADGKWVKFDEAEKRIAELEQENKELIKIAVKEKKFADDCIVNLARDRKAFDLEQQAKVFELAITHFENLAKDTPLGYECKSKGSSQYNWMKFAANELRQKAQELKNV